MYEKIVIIIYIIAILICLFSGIMVLYTGYRAKTEEKKKQLIELEKKLSDKYCYLIYAHIINFEGPVILSDITNHKIIQHENHYLIITNWFKMNYLIKNPNFLNSIRKLIIQKRKEFDLVLVDEKIFNHIKLREFNPEQNIIIFEANG